MRGLRLAEQGHPELLRQEECQSGGTESSERRSVPSHDLRQLPGYWRSRYRS